MGRALWATGYAFLLSSLPAGAQCDGLLSWESYGIERHAFPYTLRLSRSPGGLVMFGSRHTSDPQDAQIPEVERLWREFRPEIAFSEGGIRPPARSRDQAVRQFGEPGLLRWLADRDHVPLRSLEAEEEEATALAREVDPARVKLFYVLRDMSHDSPGRDGRSAEDTAARALDQVRRRRGMAGPPRSIEEVKTLVARLLPELKDWSTPPDAWFNPARSDNFLNDIARRSTLFRNCHMLRLVVDAVRGGKRVFVVVGGSHVVIQEPALRAALAP